MFVNFLALLKNATFIVKTSVASFWSNFGNNWVTLYANTWVTLRRSVIVQPLRSEMNVYSKGQQSAGRLKIYLNENNLAFCYYKSDTVPVH